MTVVGDDDPLSSRLPLRQELQVAVVAEGRDVADDCEPDGRKGSSSDRNTSAALLKFPPKAMAEGESVCTMVNWMML